MRVHVFVQVCAHLCVCACVCLRACVHVCARVCVCVYVCARAHLLQCWRWNLGPDSLPSNCSAVEHRASLILGDSLQCVPCSHKATSVFSPQLRGCWAYMCAPPCPAVHIFVLSFERESYYVALTGLGLTTWTRVASNS